MMPQYTKVNWSKLVLLVQGQLPWKKFILWLALNKRLTTVDRILKWGKTISTDCVICNGKVMETSNHLF